MNYSRYTAEDLALDKYFQRWVLRPDTESSQFWQAWLDAHPEKRQVAEEAIQLIRQAGFSADYEANTAYLEVWDSLRTHTRQMAAPRWTGKALRYAAVLVGFMLMMSGLLWYTLFRPDAIRYQTAYGETKEVVLPDGSRVTLNANSRLNLTNGAWGKGDSREVYLDGEAFFEVVKTKDQKKFVVKTSDQLDVQVLGTEFNVNTRRDVTRVYLQSGKVKIRAAGGEATLQPGQLAEYQEAARKVHVKQADSESWLAWRDNMFVFDDVPLAVVAQAIEDQFGMKVTITNAVQGQQRFTGRIPRQDLDVLLKVVAETLKINITKHRQEVIVQPLAGGD